MSRADEHFEHSIIRGPNIEELARLQHAEPVEADELACDIWESDEELDAFLADFRSSRNVSVV